MKNIEDTLWKLLGEYIEVQILPDDWYKNGLYELEILPSLCKTEKGFLCHIENKWFLGDLHNPIDLAKIYRIKYDRDFVV